MAILQRTIHHVKRGKWDELMAVEAKYDAFQKRIGWPPRKRYRGLIGGHNSDTEIIEREWESFTAWEVAANKLSTETKQEIAALQEESDPLIESTENEAYLVL